MSDIFLNLVHFKLLRKFITCLSETVEYSLLILLLRLKTVLLTLKVNYKETIHRIIKKHETRACWFY